jgi:hypothetical protein
MIRINNKVAIKYLSRENVRTKVVWTSMQPFLSDLVICYDSSHEPIVTPNGFGKQTVDKKNNKESTN